MKIRIEKVEVEPLERPWMPLSGISGEFSHEIVTRPPKVTMEVYIDKSDANYVEEINKIMRQGFGHLVADEPSKSKLIIKDGGLEAYDETGAMRVKIGDLDSTIPPEIKFKSSGSKNEFRHSTVGTPVGELADDIKDAYAYSKVAIDELPPWYKFVDKDYDAYGNLIAEQKKTHKKKDTDKPSVQLEESW